MAAPLPGLAVPELREAAGGETARLAAAQTAATVSSGSPALLSVTVGAVHETAGPQLWD